MTRPSTIEHQVLGSSPAPAPQVAGRRLPSTERIPSPSTVGGDPGGKRRVSTASSAGLIDTTPTAAQVTNALGMAIQSCKPTAGTLIHLLDRQRWRTRIVPSGKTSRRGLLHLEQA
jgi:hypothetical protein